MEDRFLKEAVELAARAVRERRGGPFGAVIVQNGTVIGEGMNEVTTRNDPTAHAEIQAIRDACRRTASFQLQDSELYTSCEPCPMCLGAILWARIGSFYYACTRADAAAAGFDDATFHERVATPPRGQVHDAELRREALAVFQSWLRDEKRIVY